MLHKQPLAEQFIIYGELDDVSKVDIKLLRNHTLSSFADTLDSSHLRWKKHYRKVNYHQHIQWVQDYIRDHWREKYDFTLVPLVNDGISGLIQQTNEVIPVHQHIDEFNLHGSPDYSALYCVGMGEKQSSITIHYDDGRRRMRSWTIPMKVGRFIVWPSHLKHEIDKNTNKDFLVNLSFKYQRLD